MDCEPDTGDGKPGTRDGASGTVMVRLAPPGTASLASWTVSLAPVMVHLAPPCTSIGLNRPALGGTVPNYTTMSRRPALLTFCPAFINHPVLGGTSLIQVYYHVLPRHCPTFLPVIFFVYIELCTHRSRSKKLSVASPARIARISRGQREPLLPLSRLDVKIPDF